MKYCTKCGKQLFDEAVFCPGCGCPVPVAGNQYAQYQPQYQQPQKKESSGTATAAIICAFLLPVIGLILGIVGNSKYTDPNLKRKSKAAIFLSIGMWIIYFVIFSVMIQL